MKNLSEILAKKAEIITLVERFGFQSEVRIFCEEPLQKNETTNLVLLIRDVPQTEVSYKNNAWLSAKLSEMLGCKTDARVLEGIESLYKNYMFEKSALIQDEKAVCALFGATSPHAVSFEEGKNPSLIALKQADDYLSSLIGDGKKVSVAKKLSSQSMLESDHKKAKHESSESPSPPGSTESPQKTQSYTSNNKK